MVLTAEQQLKHTDLYFNCCSALANIQFTLQWDTNIAIIFIQNIPIFMKIHDIRTDELALR